MNKEMLDRIKLAGALAKSADGRALGDVAVAAAQEAMNAQAELATVKRQLAKSEEKFAVADATLRGVEPLMKQLDDDHQREIDQIRKDARQRERIAKREAAEEKDNEAILAAIKDLAKMFESGALADSIVKARLAAYKAEDQDS